MSTEPAVKTSVFHVKHCHSFANHVPRETVDNLVDNPVGIVWIRCGWLVENVLPNRSGCSGVYAKHLEPRVTHLLFSKIVRKSTPSR